jgi:hypothetical protein
VNKQLEKMMIDDIIVTRSSSGIRLMDVIDVLPYSKAENETTIDAFDEFIANVCEDVYGQLFRIQSKSNVKTEK